MKSLIGSKYIRLPSCRFMHISGGFTVPLCIPIGHVSTLPEKIRHRDQRKFAFAGNKPQNFIQYVNNCKRKRSPLMLKGVFPVVSYRFKSHSTTEASGISKGISVSRIDLKDHYLPKLSATSSESSMHRIICD